jgi:hypothetical protein
MLEFAMAKMGIRRKILATLLGVFCVATAAAAATASQPPGATARCRDGTYSFSQHHSGACSHHGGVAVWLDTGTAGGSRTSGSGAATSRSVGATVLLQTRTRTSGCRLGPRPDRRCSPGAYYSGLTRAVICSAGFRTSSIRNVPQDEKFAVEREYGMRPAYYGRSIEIDHIVSLELGGSNDIANLFPEPGVGAASYHAKDRLENRLHDMVCAGQIGLRDAQRGIAADWESLYRRVFGAPPVG